MKHAEIYDKHADQRKRTKHKKKKLGEHDEWDRRARTSFKNYVRDLRQAELEDELDDFETDELPK